MSRFCSVCQEGIWSQFLQRISLIDAVIVAPGASAPLPVEVQTLRLGQLRAPGNEVVGERLEIRWALNGTEQSQYNDLFSISADEGSWAVTVKLISPEVRADPQNLLTETEYFAIPFKTST